MMPQQATLYRLEDEQRARVKDCLRKDGLSLPTDRLQQLIRSIEGSISNFLAVPPQEAFRNTHDALRDLWKLSHEDDPSVALLRARIQQLPREAVEYVDRRAPTVLSRLFSHDRPIVRFQEWAVSAGPELLITATRVLSAEGGRFVPGRSRGRGKRSSERLEPVIMGEIRGGGAARHRGGRPRNEGQQELVMHLALDWLIATGAPPGRGRSDNTGFGDLVHSIFQWLRLKAASNSLREYWVAVQTFETREPLEAFLRRYRAEP
jgi:hypothetical protein